MAELRALARERDPAMFDEQLLAFGERLEADRRVEVAAQVYAAIAPGFPEIQKRARERLDALLGRGHGGLRAEVLLKNFAGSATDYRTIVPMIAGSAVYQLTKAASLGRLAMTPNATWLTRGFGARAVSSLLGTAAEVPAFSLLCRGLMDWSGEKVSWDAGSVGKDLLGAGLTLGVLKISGWGMREIPGVSALRPWQQAALHSGAAFTGLLAAHQAETAVGLRARVDGATSVTDTLASLVSLEVGGHLGRRMLGPQFARFQRLLALQADSVPASPASRNFPGFAPEVPVAAGGRLAVDSRGADPVSRRPAPMMSERKDDDGTLPENPRLSAGDEAVSVARDPEVTKLSRPVSPPRWTRKVELDDASLAKMEKLPSNLQARWQEQGANPVFFGLNHLKWWMGLIKRDAGERGVDAITLGGKILFGRWQEKALGRSVVEDTLAEIADHARLDVSWIAPSAASWWRPLWERLLHDPMDGSTRAVLQGTLLEQIKGNDPGLVETWLHELALRDFDHSEAVRDAMDKETLFPTDDFRDPGLQAWLDAWTPGDFDALNRKTEELFPAALEEPDPWIAIQSTADLKRALEAQSASHLAPPAAVSPRPAETSLRIHPGWSPAQAVEYLLRKLPSQIPNSGLLSYGSTVLAPFFAALSFVASVLGNSDLANAYWQRAEAELENIKRDFPGMPNSFGGREDALRLRQGQFPSGQIGFPKVAELARQEEWEAVWKQIARFPDPYTQALFLVQVTRIAKEQNQPWTAAEIPLLSLMPSFWAAPFPQVLSVGRALNADIRTDNPSVSREHADLFQVVSNEIWIGVMDKGSSNGTFLDPAEAPGNPVRLQPHEQRILKRGEWVRIGPIQFHNTIPEQLPPLRFQAEYASAAPDRITLFFTEKTPANDHGELMQNFNSMTDRVREKTSGNSSTQALTLAFLSYAAQTAAPLTRNPKFLIEKAKLWVAESDSHAMHIARHRGPLRGPLHTLEELRAGNFPHSLIKSHPWKELFDHLIRRKQWLAALWLSQGSQDALERATILAYWADLYQKNKAHGGAQAAFPAGTAGYIPVHEDALPAEAKRAGDWDRAFTVEMKSLPPVGGALQGYLEKLPRREPSSVPAEFRHLIPRPGAIVHFPRFRNILDESAYLINAPDRIAVRFFGPPGTAKTTIPEVIAAQMGVPLLRFPFSRRTDAGDLEGSWTREEIDGELVPVFKEGIPTLAMEHGFHLVLDEPDLARPGTLAFLNNVSAPGSHAWVRKRNGSLAKIAVHPGYRAYSTENGVGEVAREEHGRDFLRRFVPYHVGSWSREEVAFVLRELYENVGGKKRWDGAATDLFAYFHDKMDILAKGLTDPETRQALPPLGSGIGQNLQFTPRSALRLAMRLAASGPLTPESLSRAVRSEYILPLADSSDRETVWTQAQAIFAPLGKRLGWIEDIGPERIPQPTLNSISEKYLAGRPIPNDSFVWTDQALRVVDEVLWNRSLGVDVMLVGEASEGKTEIPQQIAKLTGLDYYQKTVSGETDEADLVGGIGRTNGKIEFIPDILTLVTRDGGIGHFEEYLLADTGKLEGVMNPLMDASRTLIVKNPYFAIPRHADSFFIFTSNHPFGEYADRQEHSGAAMSRIAVIYMTEEFGMKAKDRLKIMKAWLGSGSGESGGSTGPERRSIWFSPTASSELVPLKLHPEVLEKLKRPLELAFDPAKRRVVQKNSEGTWVELEEAARHALQRYEQYLTRRTQVEMVPLTRKVFKLNYALGGGHRTDLTTKQIQLDMADLLALPVKAALGVGKHEWAHGVIDRPSKVYDASESGRLFANVVGDPRMNEYAGSLREDFAEQIAVLNDEIWPETWDAVRVERFRDYLPHEQFAYGIIYAWRHGKLMPWIRDEKVVDALERALPILKPAFTLFPQSTEDRDVDRAAAEFYEILDRAYPIYRELIPEGLDELKKKLAAGEKPESLWQAVPPGRNGGGSGDGEAQPAWSEDPGTAAAQILDARAGRLADAFEPRDEEAFRKRQEQIAAAKQGKDPAGENKDDPEPEALPEPPLSAREMQDVAERRRQIFQDQVQNDLFRTRVPPRALQMVQRLKRFLPPEDPSLLEGFFTTGKRLDRNKAVEDTINPTGDGKMMLRMLRPGKRNANLVFISDVTESVVLAGAREPLLKASAAGIYLSEQLKIDYGEILMGGDARVIKELGRPVNSYKKKNRLLDAKRQAFEDREFNGSTNIRKPLALAIQWLKDRKAKTNHILLFTDGGENVVTHPQSLPELEAQAEAEGIHLMVLGMGAAGLYLSKYFKKENYRRTAPDGSDIPDRMIELFEEAHKRRLRGKSF